MKKIFLVVFALMLVSKNASSKTVTIICKSPTGWVFEHKGKNSQIETDGFNGVTFSYVWDTKTRMASVPTQNSAKAGGTPQTDKGFVFPSKTYILFVVN